MIRCLPSKASSHARAVGRSPPEVLDTERNNSHTCSGTSRPGWADALNCSGRAVASMVRTRWTKSESLYLSLSSVGSFPDSAGSFQSMVSATGGLVISFDIDKPAASRVLVNERAHQMNGHAIFDEVVEGRFGSAVEVSCHEHQAWTPHENDWGIRFREGLPIGEEPTLTTVVEPSQFIKRRAAGPAGVFQALRQLPTIHISFHLDDHDVGLLVESDDVGPATARDVGLTCHRKKRLAGELLQVVPQEILDLAFVALLAPSAYERVEGRGRWLSRRGA